MLSLPRARVQTLVRELRSHKPSSVGGREGGRKGGREGGREEGKKEERKEGREEGWIIASAKRGTPGENITHRTTSCPEDHSE